MEITIKRAKADPKGELQSKPYITVAEKDGTLLSLTETPCLWAVVNPKSEKIKVNVRIFGTGHEGITAEMEYIGTYQLANGSLVFHVFIEGRA